MDFKVTDTKGDFLNFRGPYQAKVMKMFDMRRSPIVFMNVLWSKLT